MLFDRRRPSRSVGILEDTRLNPHAHIESTQKLDANRIVIAEELNANRWFLYTIDLRKNGRMVHHDKELSKMLVFNHTTELKQKIDRLGGLHYAKENVVRYVTTQNNQLGLFEG